ncbi:MAG: RNA polymerase sigma factor [Flavobacteriaceae bacterium]|nr:RNA polymerase sigma factor [Flavobacteriaceae bacterium]
MNESVLIQKCKKNDYSAQLEVYNMYKNMMFNASLRIVRNRHDAEDIVQESFMKGFEKINQLKEGVNLGAWLKRIVMNASLDVVRKRKKESWLEETVLIESDCEEDDFENDSKVTIQFIKDCMEELKEKYRIILVLYMIEDYNHREISELLSMKESTVRNQYIRGKNILLEMIQKRNKHEFKGIHTGT